MKQPEKLTLGGKEFALDIYPNDLICNIMRKGDFYEREFLDKLKERHGKAKCIFDIGANVGNHSLFFATFFEAKEVHAFEPLPESFYKLVNNLDNNIDKFGKTKVAAHNVFLSDNEVPTTTGMCVHNRNNMGALTEWHGGGVVPKIRLDDFFQKEVHPDLIKIDVEGAELEVLKGAINYIKHDRPVIVAECNDIFHCHDIFNWLKSFDYQITYINNRANPMVEFSPL